MTRSPLTGRPETSREAGQQPRNRLVARLLVAVDVLSVREGRRVCVSLTQPVGKLRNALVTNITRRHDMPRPKTTKPIRESLRHAGAEIVTQHTKQMITVQMYHSGSQNADVMTFGVNSSISTSASFVTMSFYLTVDDAEDLIATMRSVMTAFRRQS